MNTPQMHGQILEDDARPAQAGLAGQQMTGWPGLGELAVGCLSPIKAH